MENYVSIIGGINIDVKGAADSGSAESDSHQGKIYISPGGVAGNIAENLALLEIPVYLFGCVGDDYFGNLILDLAKSKNVNTDYVIKSPEINTSVYLSVSNKDKSFYYAVNDMKNSTDLITTKYVRKNFDVLKNSRMIVLDTNLSAEVLNETVKFSNENNIPVFIDTVSSEKAAKVNNISGTIDFLSPNRAEFKELFGKYKDMGDLLNMMRKGKFRKYKYIILKQDKDGVDIIDTEENIIHNCGSLIVEILESSGAGDAFNAGFIFSLLNNEDLFNKFDVSGKIGLCASYFALRSYNSVSENLTKKSLLEFYNQKKLNDEFF